MTIKTKRAILKHDIGTKNYANNNIRKTHECRVKMHDSKVNNVAKFNENELEWQELTNENI